MGGSISKENTRINLIVPKKIKRKAEAYAKVSNRSTGNTCLRILTNPVVAEKFHTVIDTPFMREIEDMKAEGQERMNLVVPIRIKEQLQAEADEHFRSLNNYIVSFLYFYFMSYVDMDTAEASWDYFEKRIHVGDLQDPED